MLYIISRTVQQMFECGVKHLNAPHNTLDCLKGVVPKKTQKGCGHALSYHSVILENLLEIGPVVSFVLTFLRRLSMACRSCVGKSRVVLSVMHYSNVF